MRNRRRNNTSCLFQFHKGTIKTVSQPYKVYNVHNFNSIKVRLKRRYTQIRCIGVREFQFHKGTIKTARQLIINHIRIKFQFHKGTIKTLYAFAV